MTKRGRPLRGIDDLPDGWEEKVLALGRQGASDAQIQAELGISAGLFYALLKREIRFWYAVKKADELRFLLWMREGRTNLRRPGCNHTAAVAAV